MTANKAHQNKLVLVDGMALAYRGYFALIRNPRITTYKLNTSAIYVFTNVLIDLIASEKPTHIAVAFDTREPTFRHKEFKQYKVNREAMPEDLSKSLPYIDKLCTAFNIPALRYPGWEADDVIGTLAKLAEDSDFQTCMVTPDKDYTQLVSENTLLYRPARGGAGFDVLGPNEIIEEWGVEDAKQVIDILGLMGDASDNIPGVPGIGKKTAQKLIAEYGSIESLLAHLDDLKGKQKEVLENNQDKAHLSKHLVTIIRDVPLTHSVDDLKYKGPDVEAVQELFKELEFQSIGRRLFGEQFEAATVKQLKTLKDIAHDYSLVDTVEKRKLLLERLLEQKSVCFDLETTGLDEKTCRIVGIAFSWTEKTGFFMLFPEEVEAYNGILSDFSVFFESDGIEKIGHNIKFDLSVLRWHRVVVRGPFFDTMVAAYLCIPDERRSMDALAETLLDYAPVHIEKLIGEKGTEQKSMGEVPVGELVEYACEDSDITLQLSAIMRPMIEEYGQSKVFFDIECPLVPVLVEMEYAGIRIDTAVLSELDKQLGIEIARASERIETLAGEPFNLNSPKQLGEILFDKLALDPHAKRTKKSGQYITNEQVLARLAGRHEIVEKILEYRMKSKLKSTYVDMLPASIFAGTQRIHTSYEQAVTATGRMQSHDPNLQNIPIRSEQGKEIRKAFVPGDDRYQLFSADYSQIELRIAAALSGDKSMLAAFESEQDIHTSTAAHLFGVEMSEVTQDMRRHAKTVNFGILYGISAFGLSERSELSRSEAAELINSYFRQYSSLKRWQDETIEFSRMYGYVETATGRRRYLRDINSKNATIRGAAERTAINSPIQGTAADMIKIAMISIQKELEKRTLKTRMLLQVHDELVFELHKDESDQVPAIVEECMVNALPLGVPIVVETGLGENWLDAH